MTADGPTGHGGIMEARGTLQTTSPIVELQAEHSSRAIMWFQMLAEDDESHLDIDQPYQRGDVWGTRRRQLLILSLEIADRMEACPNNPRNGGDGFDMGDGTWRDRRWTS